MMTTVLERLKVAHVIPDLNLNVTGGVGVFLRTLIQYLDCNRVESIVVTFKSDEKDRLFFEHLGIPVFSHLLTADAEIEPSIQVMEWLIKIFQSISPDVVHTNLFWADTLGRQAAYRAKVPVIVATEHNKDLQETSRQRAIKRQLAAFTDRVVCVSQAVSHHARDVDGIPGDRILALYNGIPLENSAIADWKQSGQNPGFVFVGRLEPQKAPLRLIEAFAKVVAEYPDCQLSIVGDGNLMKICCDRVEALGLTKQVQFLGYHPKPWCCVTPGSIFVLTSDYEGHPLAVLEAMATGHLSVLPDLPGISEMVEAGKEAIVYGAGDRDNLITAMRSALEMPMHQRLQIIQAARARVERDFDANQMAERYLQLYQELYDKKVLQVTGFQPSTHNLNQSWERY